MRAAAPLRELHIGALPFPTYQGTQAAIASMLEARARAGVEVEFLTYGERGYAAEYGYPVRRSSRRLRVSLRSGPSWSKVAVDVRMVAELRALVRERRPQVLVAHHVEAMLVACSVPGLPRVFFAHTDLGAELPTYTLAAAQHALLLPAVPLMAASRAPFAAAELPSDMTPHTGASRAPSAARLSRLTLPSVAGVLGWAGHSLDRWLCRRASAIAAISPVLDARLSALATRPVRYVPVPWAVPEPITRDERVAARLALGFGAEDVVALYAGNLDGYQDAERMLEALQLMASHGQRAPLLLLATQSEPRDFLARAVQSGVAFRTCPLGGEPVRRLIHAAADFAMIPRGIAGGLPIKLLDALARGLPCACMPLATAGLPLTDALVCARAQTSPALAEAIATLADQPARRHALSERARHYVATAHSDRAFALAFNDVIARAHEAGEHADRHLHVLGLVSR
jgi:glycosyltransferase involved in cell wall biosynthesis